MDKKIRDSDVYDYRKSKLMKLNDYLKQEMANDTSKKISVRTSIGFIDGYIYYPKHLKTKCVYFNMHGGGMCLGYYQLDIPYCKLICEKSGAIVVNIDYCLAPEYKFPLAYSTTYEFIKYCDSHRRDLDFEGKKFIVGGSSAGGQIAAALVQLQNKDKNNFIKGLVMNYAPCSQNNQLQTYIDPQKAISINRIQQYQYWEYDNFEDMDNPLSSLLNSDFSIYPPTLINSAEYDSLRKGEEIFRDSLIKENIKVNYKCYKDCQHGFTHKDLKEFNPDASKDAWNRIINFIKEMANA